MSVPFGTGPVILTEPFTYSNGALSAAAGWSGPMIPGNGNIQITSNQLTHGSDGTYMDAYTDADYGDGDYILTVVTQPAEGRRIFLHATVQAEGTAGVDSWTLDFLRQAATTDRWRLRSLTDTLLDLSVVDTNREGADGMKMGLRIDGSIVSAWTDITASGTWTQLGTDQTVTPLGSGKIGIESNGGALVIDNLEVRALSANLAPPDVPIQRRFQHLLVR